MTVLLVSKMKNLILEIKFFLALLGHSQLLEEVSMPRSLLTFFPHIFIDISILYIKDINKLSETTTNVLHKKLVLLNQSA